MFLRRSAGPFLDPQSGPNLMSEVTWSLVVSKVLCSAGNSILLGTKSGTKTGTNSGAGGKGFVLSKQQLLRGVYSSSFEHRA